MNVQLKIATAYLAPAQSSLESALIEVPQLRDYHLDRGVPQNDAQ